MAAGGREGEGRRPRSRSARVREKGPRVSEGKSLAFPEKQRLSRVSKRSATDDFLALALEISQLIIRTFGGIISFISLKI